MTTRKPRVPRKRAPDRVSSKAELALRLKVSRRSISRWFSIAEHPQPLSNGEHSVKAWRTFIRRHGLKGGESSRSAALKRERLLLEVRELRRIDRKREAELVEVKAVREELARIEREQAAVLKQFRERLAVKLEGLPAADVLTVMEQSDREFLRELRRRKI